MLENFTNNPHLNRLGWVDILRGIAILIMVPANFSMLWALPHPLWFRIIASYAAPTFIMLSAGMVILNKKQHDFGYFLYRGLKLLICGCFIDLFIWHITPFISFDVLYLIGVGLPIAYLVRKTNNTCLAMVGLLFFCASLVLQKFFGYHSNILEVYPSSILRLFQSWFVDGWFPIFPWLGYIFFSVILFRSTLLHLNPLSLKIWLCVAGTILCIGFLLLFLPYQWPGNNLANQGILAERDGFSEIFYPPGLPYLLSSLGMMIVLMIVSQSITDSRLTKVIMLFGRHSLFIYIFHQAIIALMLFTFMKIYKITMIANSLLIFSVVFSVLIGCYLLCLAIESLSLRKLLGRL